MGALTRILSGGQSDDKSKDNRSPGQKRGNAATSSSTRGGSNTMDANEAPPVYHRGGKVRKTGLARLKKGERVLTKGQQKRLMKRRGGKSR